MCNPCVEVHEYNEVGYSSVVDFKTWRVAMLNYIDELEVENIDNFQCHQESDEVFILLQGQCLLFCAEVDKNNKISDISSYNLELNKIYNVKRGTYHTHTLTKNAKVIIVENQDTDDSNSPKIMLDKSITEKLKVIKSKAWSN